jgi:predicted enzyme related to lactoylglutathione lyase
MNLVVYPVDDLTRAKAIYSTFLGTEPYADAPYYVGYKVGDREVGLDPNGHKSGITGPIGYVDVDDIGKAVQELVEAGASVRQDAKDVGGGKLIALLDDGAGNVIGLSQNP